MGRTRKAAQSFTDSGSGYATEVLYLLNTGASTTAPADASQYAGIEDLTVLYSDIGTDTLLKVEILVGSTWYEFKSMSAVGSYEVSLLGATGVRLRALSQGNADTAIAVVVWR